MLQGRKKLWQDFNLCVILNRINWKLWRSIFAVGNDHTNVSMNLFVTVLWGGSRADSEYNSEKCPFCMFYLVMMVYATRNNVQLNRSTFPCGCHTSPSSTLLCITMSHVAFLFI
jgi:hypothetical protein